MEYIISALIAAVVSYATVVINHWWQLRKDVRSENLDHYRILKTAGYMFIELPGSKSINVDEVIERYREGMVQLGTAIFEIDLSASRHVLHALVEFFREVDAFGARMQQLATKGTKLSPSEFEAMKTGMRKSYVNLFFAMRADAGRSNLWLKKEDIEYLLFIRFGNEQVS